MRVMLPLLFAAAVTLAAPAEAQWRRASLVAPASSVQNAVDEAPPALTAPVVTKQILSGAAGAVLGALAGAAVSSLFLDSSDGSAWTDLGTMVGVSLVGGAVGGATGVSLYSRRAGMRAPFIAPLAGAALGLVGITAGPAVFVTIPLGATVGYNLARRE